MTSLSAELNPVKTGLVFPLKLKKSAFFNMLFPQGKFQKKKTYYS